MAIFCTGEMELVVSNKGNRKDSLRRDEEACLNDALEFGDIIGMGAFSVIRRARQRHSGEVIAVKCVKCDNAHHQEAIRREYYILRSFDTPTVVSALSLFEVGRTMTMYLCMEYCELGNLYTHVKTCGPFRLKYTCILFGQFMSGISYIHCRRVVHCDVKHQNLLLRGRFEDFTLKIADFDTARRVGRTIRVKRACHGTRQFKAPELVFHGKWNERIDIWAGGLCFYFMLTGNLPFDICSQEVVKALLIGMLPCVTCRVAHALGQHFLEQCLSVSAHDRPPALELSHHPVFDLKAEERICSEDLENSSAGEHVARTVALGFGYHEHNLRANPDVSLETRMIDSVADVFVQAGSSHTLRSLTVETRSRTRLSSFLSGEDAFRQLVREKSLRATGGLNRENDLHKRSWCVT
eukprot:TRINITY_DN58309_c0_g1_i1.p1 TRINITY_DN58309_c0_g1~~TRINITY_DN58309_c0_g1_i1.p1  ORF type:complete len:409 (+),score=37.31 TRINITY_DN58309_c0_g1_i1:19-1245(+)